MPEECEPSPPMKNDRGESAPAVTSWIRTASSQSLQNVDALLSQANRLPSRRTKPVAGAVRVTVVKVEKGKPPVRFSVEAIAIRPRPLASTPSSLSAFRFATFLPELTEKGACPLATVRPSAVAPLVVLVFTT